MKGIDDFDSDNSESAKHTRFKGLKLDALEKMKEEEEPEISGPGAWTLSPEHFIKYVEQYEDVTFEGLATEEGDEVTRIIIDGIKYKGPVTEKMLLDFISRFGGADEIEAEVLGYDEMKEHHIAFLRAWYD